MGGIRFSVCRCQPENPFVCFGAKTTQRAWVRDPPRDRKRSREGRSQRRQRESVNKGRQKDTVSRREQKGPVDRAGQSGRWKQDREERRTEVRKTTAKTCWSTEAGLTNARKWVSIPSGFVEVSRNYTPAIDCRCAESYTKVSQTSPFLRLELTQARVCLFFSSTLSVVLCLSVKKCVMPLVWNH